jgi:amino acid adenylation domain-containing protein
MTTVQFLNHLQSLNVRVWLQDGNLRIRALPGVLTAGLKSELSERKPEIVKLLRLLPHGSPEKPAVIRAPREGRIPLTFAQQRLWFVDQLHPASPAYNICDINEIQREIDLIALQHTLNELVRRHEILRTSFPAVDGVPMQRIAPPSEVPLPVVDLTGLPERERALEARRMASEEVRRPFDLACGPLFRVCLARLEAARYLSLVSIHHIICDGWSMKLLDQELETLYAAYCAGRASPLPELPIQWADFAVWQHQWLRGPVLDSHVEYWSSRLEGELPTLNVPKDHARRDVLRGGHGRFSFTPSLSCALKKLSESERVTLFMALLAGYAALLARYTGQNDIIIGSPVSDRGCIEAESLIGFFLNTLPLRIRVDEKATFQELLQHVKEACLGGYTYQAVPYEELMQRRDVERDSSGTPVFQTLLVLLNTPEIQSSAKLLARKIPVWMIPEIEIVEGDVGAWCSDEGNGATRFDLSITLFENESGIRGSTEYNRDIFDEETIVKLVERFQRLLRSAAANPRQRICELELMPQQEREELLVSSRGMRTSCEVSCLHQFVESQARRQPLAVAVEGSEESLSYAELNARANRLACWLRARGASQEASVGVFFERTPQLLIAVLGVLKAGAAYVPLDPAHPISRLESIIEDAGIDVVVTTQAMAANLRSDSLRTVCLDRDAAEIGAHDPRDPSCAVSSENLACVLYTSGSTGRPKGVLLTHGAVVNFIAGATLDCAIGPTDRVLQFASIAFDSSLEEFFLAFSTGAALVLRPVRMLDSTAGFARYCEQLRLTVLVLPTAYWHEVVATLAEHNLPPCVRCVVIGGERALSEKLARWQECIGGRVALFNAYGPTEGTIAVTRYKAPEAAGESSADREVSIGRPVDGARALGRAG